MKREREKVFQKLYKLDKHDKKHKNDELQIRATNQTSFTPNGGDETEAKARSSLRGQGDSQ